MSGPPSEVTGPWKDLLSERLPGLNRLVAVEVGSTAHGTALDGNDDFDVSVIWVESPTDVYGLGQRKQSRMVRSQPEGSRSGPGDIDINVYTLRQWLRLAAKGNPSILQMLWCPILEAGPVFGWLLLRTEADAFIGRHLLDPYMGYMRSQVDRITGKRGGGHGRRGSGGREELIEAHGYDTKFAMHAARLGFQCQELLGSGGLQLPMTGPDGDWLRSVRRGEVPFDEWLAMVEDLDRKLHDLRTNENIPVGADTARIDEMAVQIHQGDLIRKVMER